MGVGNSLEYVGENNYQNRYLTETNIINAIIQSKNITPGPVTNLVGLPHDFLPNESILISKIWEVADILMVGNNLADAPFASSNNPTVEQVTASLKRYIDQYFQPFQRRFNKPFLPHENGCFSFDGAVKWGIYAEFLENSPYLVDITDMEIYYLAHTLAYEDMEGYFGPGWYPYSLNPYRLGGANDTGSIPRLKIEGLIEELFTGTRSSHLIRIDGTSNDWTENLLVAEDPIGDNKSGDDIVSLSAHEDESYLYLHVGYHESSPNGTIVINIDLNSNGVVEYNLQCDNIYSENKSWRGFLYSNMRDYRITGFADTADTAKGIELRIPKRFLGEYDSVSIRVIDMNYQWNRTEDSTSFYELF